MWRCDHLKTGRKCCSAHVIQCRANTYRWICAWSAKNNYWDKLKNRSYLTNSSITTICHHGYFRTLSQGKIWDIIIAIPNIEVVNEEYKRICFIPVDHDTLGDIFDKIIWLILSDFATFYHLKKAWQKFLFVNFTHLENLFFRHFL